ncbi:MAG TPA: GntR family transcriptional regulator [Solirubrobacteraceae bacterium]|jgi:DNA-binding transcriptional regulator YhcF (GntR family)|nr:GntR family transcriptional regulator [Solirubrobacteraceae bacterium]
MPRAADNARAGAIAVDRKADVPVGVQLGWAICAQIRDGRLAPGQQLPTLREMAVATGLNVNTVRAVYRRLEQKGLIDSQQGSGTFVATALRHAAALASIAANAAHEARETGLDPRDVAAALYVAPGEATDSQAAPAHATAASSEAARRRALRDQIATLERTVAELEAEHPGVAPAPARARRGIGPTLLTVDELAQVRATLIRRLTLVQAAIDGHVAEQRASARAKAPARKPAKPKAQTAGGRGRAAKPRATTRPAAASG